jgi:hypothetical protein
VAQRSSFSSYLLGQASLERPPFFYAYAAMWLHLLAGSLVILLFTDLALSSVIASVAVGSFCLGLVVYGVMARAYGLLANVVSYAAAMARLAYHSELHPLLLIGALVLALVSGYHLLGHEYRRYTRDVFNEPGRSLPAWIGAAMSVAVVLICVLGLNLM